MRLKSMVGTADRSRAVRRPALLAVVALLVAGVLSTVTGGKADAVPRGQIVVLGDSFTSDVWILDDPCAQTPSNWPSQLGRQTGHRIVNMSCTGGRMFGNPNVYDQAQRARAKGGFNASTRAVLVQLGFNDFGAGRDFYVRCVLSGCPGGQAAFPQVTAKRIADRLDPLVKYVRHYAPDAKIALVGYPEMYAPGTRDICTKIAGAPVTFPNTSAAPGFSERLQRAQSGAADRLGVSFVNVQAATRGHGMCAADPWVRGVLTPAPEDLASGFMIGHPTPRGNTAAAGAVRRTLGL